MAGLKKNQTNKKLLYSITWTTRETNRSVQTLFAIGCLEVSLSVMEQ